MTEPRALTGPEIVERVRSAPVFTLIKDLPFDEDVPSIWVIEIILTVLDAIREPSEATIEAARGLLNVRQQWRAQVNVLKREVVTLLKTPNRAREIAQRRIEYQRDLW